MVPYQTPMSSGPGPDPLQAALTSANQMAGQLAPTQPGAGPYMRQNMGLPNQNPPRANPTGAAHKPHQPMQY